MNEIALLSTMAAMTSIAFNREHDVDYGACEQLTPLIRRVTANNPSPFTFKGTGTYIIGRGEVAVIDPGPDDEAHLQALLQALGAERVSHILVTHTHSDHSGLVPKFKAATGAPVYAYATHTKNEGNIESGNVELDASADHDFKPDVELAHGDTIEGGDWTFEAVFTPGHMSNHMSFALPQEKALFAGDHVMAWSTSVIAPPDGRMSDYMASLDLLLTRDDEIYWPTHGGPVHDPKPFVQAFIEHRQAREHAILERLAAGDDTISDMVPKIYQGVDPKLFPAAAMSLLAHMEYLVEKGDVTTNDAPNVQASYQMV